MFCGVVCGVEGKRNTTTKKIIQTTAIAATGKLYINHHSVQVSISDKGTEVTKRREKRTNFPKLNGPGLKLFWKMKRTAIGMVNATYCPVTPREKIAPIASAPAKDSSPRQSAKQAPIHTPLTGVLV